MTKASYVAAICGEVGNYGVVFPDLPGCVSAGDDIAQAEAMAQEALQLHLEGMVEDGDPLPTPTRLTLDQIAEAFNDLEEPSEDSWIKLIEVAVDVPDRANTVPVQVKADLVRQIADLAESTARQIDSRRFIEQAVEHELDRYRKSA